MGSSVGSACVPGPFTIPRMLHCGRYSTACLSCGNKDVCKCYNDSGMMELEDYEQEENRGEDAEFSDILSNVVHLVEQRKLQRIVDQRKLGQAGRSSGKQFGHALWSACAYLQESNKNKMLIKNYTKNLTKVLRERALEARGLVSKRYIEPEVHKLIEYLYMWSYKEMEFDSFLAILELWRWAHPPDFKFVGTMILKALRSKSRMSHGKPHIASMMTTQLLEYLSIFQLRAPHLRPKWISELKALQLTLPATMNPMTSALTRAVSSHVESSTPVMLQGEWAKDLSGLRPIRSPTGDYSPSIPAATGTLIRDGKMVWVIRLSLNKNHTSSQKLQQLHFFKIIKKLRSLASHPYCLPWFDIKQEKIHGNNDLYMFRYASGGRSLTQITQISTLNERTVRKVIGTVCSALAYAHGEHVAHANLSPDVIHTDSMGAHHGPDSHFYITDWGLQAGQLYQMGVKGISRTECRRNLCTAPEGLSIDEKKRDLDLSAMDVFSLGALIIHCLCPEESPRMQKGVELITQVPRFLPVSAKELCLICMLINPRDRATAEMILQSPFLNVHTDEPEEFQCSRPTSIFGGIGSGGPEIETSYQLGSTSSVKTLNELKTILKDNDIDPESFSKRRGRSLTDLLFELQADLVHLRASVPEDHLLPHSRFLRSMSVLEVKIFAKISDVWHVLQEQNTTLPSEFTSQLKHRFNRFIVSKLRAHEKWETKLKEVIEAKLGIPIDDQPEFLTCLDHSTYQEFEPHYGPGLDTLYTVHQITMCLIETNLVTLRYLDIGLPSGTRFDREVKNVLGTWKVERWEWRGSKTFDFYNK